jgi:hypothetical protein
VGSDGNTLGYRASGERKDGNNGSRGKHVGDAGLEWESQRRSDGTRVWFGLVWRSESETWARAKQRVCLGKRLIAMRPMCRPRRRLALEREQWCSDAVR